jgi:MGT family glycosyltransferase
MSDLTLAPIRRVLNRYRRTWGLDPFRAGIDRFSPLLQISQQPPAFDFPRHQLPETFHYCGPFRDAHGDDAAFPWDKLDGRPLIYASLGTLQGAKRGVFHAIAEACAGEPYQLVMTHGGALSAAEASSFAGNPLVVPYAPQRRLLEKAALAVTHAGLNTVLDALSFGVPLVAIPITYEQPAIASRLQWTGTGDVQPLRSLTPQSLKGSIRRVLHSAEMKASAQRVADSIRDAGGSYRAANLIDAAL